MSQLRVISGISGILALVDALLAESVLVEYIAYLAVLVAFGLAALWPDPVEGIPLLVVARNAGRRLRELPLLFVTSTKATVRNTGRQLRELPLLFVTSARYAVQNPRDACQALMKFLWNNIGLIIFTLLFYHFVKLFLHKVFVLLTLAGPDGKEGIPALYDLSFYIIETEVDLYSNYTAILLALIVAFGIFNLNRGRLNQRQVNLRLQLLALIGSASFVLYFILQLLYLNQTDKSWYFDLGFMDERTGFDIRNSWPYESDLTASRWRYYTIGIISAARVVVISIILCTIIGIFVGVFRLSRNPLLSRLSEAYVELFRNMPLLVQLFFWYTAVLLAMPRLDEAIDLWGWIYISNRAVVLPRIVIDSLLLLVLAIIQIVGTRLYTRYLDRDGVDDSPEGLRKRAVLWAVALIVFGTMLKFALSLERPELVKPNPIAWGTWHYEGGMPLTLQFLGIMIGLTIYTSVQVAEIVRGSIQSLPRGQIEAAISLGLSPFQRLRLILLPQALRSMIPSLTNQYLNCWKNSSLALVIGYSDFFAISQTIVNNAGQAVPVFVMILLTYQVGSLLISALMNLLNRRVTSVKI